MILLLKKHKFTASIITLLLLICILFFKSVFFQYAWDDFIILDNELMYNGLDGLVDLFTRKNSLQLKDTFGYRPITLLSFKLEFLIFGVNTIVSHFFNILVYLFIIFSMFFIIKKYIKYKKYYLFLFGLAIFSFHPIHVEVVSNVKSRDELLGLFFSLLGLINIYSWISNKRKISFIFGLLFFILAILSKEIEAVLILITSISLIYFYPKERGKIYLFSSIGFLISSILFPYSFLYKFLLFISQFSFVFAIDLFLNPFSLKTTYKQVINFIGSLITKDSTVVASSLIVLSISIFNDQYVLLFFSFFSLLIHQVYKKTNYYSVLLLIVIAALSFIEINRLLLYILIGIIPLLIDKKITVKNFLVFYFIGIALLFGIIGIIFLQVEFVLLLISFSGVALFIYKKTSINIKYLIITNIVLSFFFIYSNYSQLVFFLTAAPIIEISEAFRDIVKENYILGNQFIHLNVFELIPNSFNVLLKYLENFFYPVNLKYYYGFNQIPLIGYGSSRFYISIFIHLFLIWLVFYYRKKDKLISFLSLSYIISVSIFTHLIIKLPDTMADRFFFIPSIFLSILTVLLLDKLFIKLKVKSQLKTYTLTTFSIVALVCLLVLSFYRQDVWESNKTLFTSDLPKLENCSRCHYNLAVELSKEYDLTKEIALQEQISYHFKKAIEIFPNAYYARLKLAIMYNMFGETDKAIVMLDELIKIYNNKSEQYFEKGKILFENKKYLKSFKQFDKSIQLFNNNPNYYYYQAWAAFNLISFDKAIQIAEFAKNKFKDNYMFPDALYEFYIVKNENIKAIEVLKEYLLVYPKNQVILNKLNNHSIMTMP